MKKTFTLLFALVTVVALQAQPGNRDRRDFEDDRDNAKVIINDRDGFDKDFRGYHNDDRFSPERRIAMEVAQINREYDFRILQVRNSFFMSRFAKMRKIQQLDDQRRWEIKMVYKKYSNYWGGGRGRDHDRDHF